MGDLAVTASGHIVSPFANARPLSPTEDPTPSGEMSPPKISAPHMRVAPRDPMVDTLRFARIAKLAYRDAGDLIASADLDQFESVKYISTNNAQACVLRRPEETVVAFRGSDELGDWRDNARVRKTPLDIGGKKLGRVHRGFKQHWDSIRVAVAAEVALGDPEAAVVFVGHSLGSVCLFSAVEHAIETGVEPWCYTFGAPRLGDAAFARAAERLIPSRLVRVHNGRDPVPCAPFFWYSHAGRLVRVGEADPPECTRWNEWRAGAASFVRGAIQDHAIDDYIDVLSRRVHPAS